MTLNPNQTIREIATENPVSVRVFESLGIDYCCGGRVPIKEACDRAGIPLDRVDQMITAAGAGDSSGEPDWRNAKLADLSEHIVERHHGYMTRETPRLKALLEKSAARHGAHHPELLEIRSLFGGLSDDLFAHMRNEEDVLFPYVTEMERAVLAGEPVLPPFFGSVNNPIAQMVAEHEGAGVSTARIRFLSNNFQPPESACPTYRALYLGLSEFEADVHLHIHLENNILFPRATAMEAWEVADVLV